MGFICKIGLYFRTIRYLKPIQITSRIKRYIFSVKADLSPAPQVRKIECDNFSYIRKPVSFLAQNKFDFLNISKTVRSKGDWNDETTPKLWLYNLHYFDGLLAEATPHELKKKIIETWIKNNPPGTGNGWEPYPISLRIVNWIKWVLCGNKLSVSAEQNLATQARYLENTLEYHLLGNHLFVNIKALVFAGIYFEGEEANRWLSLGLRELNKEIPEQFLNDGAHFELSPTYHALLTEDILDIINLLTIASIDVPVLWKDTAKKALRWLQIMTRPDGYPPFFNDAAQGISPRFEDILNYARKLDIQPDMYKTGILEFLSDSGYFRYDNDNYNIIGDIGQIGASYQPAHVHCDMLSFEVFTKGAPFIVNTGISTYDVGSLRNSQRGTGAHNTVQINDLEQSEIWGGFRVGRRALIVKRAVGENYIEASHDGFKKNGAIHGRRFTFLNKSILIADTISGYDGLSVSRIHFHPDFTPKIYKDKVIVGHIEFSFENAASISLGDYNYAPEFNKLVPAKVLEIEFSNILVTQLKFQLNNRS